MRIKLPIFSYLFFLFSISAQGQGTFIYDQQSAIEGSGGEGVTVIQSAQPVGQSFTPSFSTIEFLRLWLGDANSGNSLGATVYVNIRSGSITGSILASSSAVFMPNGFQGFPDFFFSTPVTIVPGTIYYFQPIVQSGDAWVIISDPQYNYTGGIAFGNGVASSGNDIWFREGIIAPVPEPSSIALLSLGIGVLVCLHRAKKTGQVNSRCELSSHSEKFNFAPKFPRFLQPK